MYCFDNVDHVYIVLVLMRTSFLCVYFLFIDCNVLMSMFYFNVYCTYVNIQLMCVLYRCEYSIDVYTINVHMCCDVCVECVDMC